MVNLNVYYLSSNRGEWCQVVDAGVEVCILLCDMTNSGPYLKEGLCLFKILLFKALGHQWSCERPLREVSVIGSL